MLAAFIILCVVAYGFVGGCVWFLINGWTAHMDEIDRELLAMLSGIAWPVMVPGLAGAAFMRMQIRKSQRDEEKV